MLQKLDPKRSVAIDRYNSRRLIRAIEICKALGKVSRLAASSQQQVARKYDVLKIGINIPDEELRRRINIRLEKRMRQGMVAEAKSLHEQGVSFKRMRALGLEYGALADFLENKITKAEMITRLQKEIWHYAKRQMTWFKRDKDIIWIPPKISLAQKEVRNFYES
jgi:tRNA dimethylallyltransferase